MKQNNYKQKYENLLLEQHRKKYIHIPFSWVFLGRLILLLGSISLSILNFMLIISTWKLLGLGNLETEYITGYNQLLIIYPIISEYILISLSFICLFALVKGGFKKLKNYKEDGLIGALIGALIVGLIGGLSGGLIVGLIVGSIVGLIGGLIVGLIEE